MRALQAMSVAAESSFRKHKQAMIALQGTADVKNLIPRKL